MKIIIIGTNHSGISCANVLLEKFPGEHEVVMIERNSNLSYLGCGTALWVGRQIDDYQGLFYTNDKEFQAKGARIMMQTEVEKIDFENQIVYAKSQNGEDIEETYDKLVLATGSIPIQPKVPGNDLQGLHFLKLFQEGQAVDKDLARPEVETVGVIGAGYIGVEIAEAAQRRGKKVLLFDAMETSLSSYYDKDFAQMMDENLNTHGIETHFGELAIEYVGNEDGWVKELVTDKNRYQVDMIINSIGFKANIELGKDHLDLFKQSAYLVDRYQQTSDPNVYAVGDCATVYSNALQDTTYIALASNAVRSGIVAGYNIAGQEVEHVGVQGSNGINIYDLKLVSTGLTVDSAKKAGIEVEWVDHEDTQFPNFMSENYDVKIRIVYAKDSRRIVGAQIASNYDMSMGIHMFSLAIQQEVTIDTLKLTDFFFLPHFNQPYNYINVAAMKAE